METVYIDKEVLTAYLTAKLDGFDGTFKQWLRAAEEAAKIYAADSSLPAGGSSSGDRESRQGS